jgi:hypothetical protein
VKTEADTEKPDPDSGIMQSAEEHQEFTKKDPSVIPVKGRKKRRRARKPAAGRCGEPKELTRSDCGSGKHLAAACRKVSRHVEVAWCKRNSFRKYWIMDKVEPESQRARMLRRRLLLRQENGKEIWDLGGRGLQYWRIRRPTKNGIGGCKSGLRSPLGNGGTLKKILYAIFRGKIEKQVIRTSSGL